MEKYKNNIRPIVEQLSKEVGKHFNDNLKVVMSLDKFKYIINDTINEYGYEGKNFKTKYLPIIIAMALEKQEFNNKIMSVDSSKGMSKSIQELLNSIGVKSY